MIRYDKILQIPSMIEILPAFVSLPTDYLLVFPQRVIHRGFWPTHCVMESTRTTKASQHVPAMFPWQDPEKSVGGSCDSLWHGVWPWLSEVHCKNSHFHPASFPLVPHHWVTWELRCHCLLDFISGWCFENMTGKVTPDSSTSASPKAAARIHIHWFNETQWTRLGRWVKNGENG